MQKGTVVFSRLQTAKKHAAKYAQDVADDVYVIRHANGREYRLWTRKEMLEFKSEYIVAYYKYSPHEKIHHLVSAVLKTKNVTPVRMSLSRGEVRILDAVGKAWIMSLREEEPTAGEYEFLDTLT